MERKNPKKNGEQCAELSKTEIVEEKRRIYLPPETWEKVFEWIRRIELAERISLVSRRFHGIVHPRLHMKSRRFPAQNCRKMRRLEITEANVLELPQCLPPENIVGIGQITIRYFDANVLPFLASIQSLLAKEIHIYIGIFEDYPANIVALEWMLPLLCSGTILSAQVWLNDFSVVFAKLPQILANCQLLDVRLLSDNVFPQIPSLAKWLAEARGDGKPKLLAFNVCPGRQLLVDQLKQDFCCASNASPFLVRMTNCECGRFNANFRPFFARNEHTNEQLSIALVDNPRGDSAHFVLIKRCAVLISGGDRPQQTVADQQQMEMINDELGQQKRLLLHKRKSYSPNVSESGLYFCVKEEIAYLLLQIC